MRFSAAIFAMLAATTHHAWADEQRGATRSLRGLSGSGCCAWSDSSAYCGTPAPESSQWCSQNQDECKDTCESNDGIWLPTCEPLLLEPATMHLRPFKGSCVDRFGEEKDSCWCSISPTNCEQDCDGYFIHLPDLHPPSPRTDTVTTSTTDATVGSVTVPATTDPPVTTAVPVTKDSPDSTCYTCDDSSNDPCASDPYLGGSLLCHKDPRKFIHCGIGPTCYEKDCPGELVWNQSLKQCDWP